MTQAKVSDEGAPSEVWWSPLPRKDARRHNTARRARRETNAESDANLHFFVSPGAL